MIKRNWKMLLPTSQANPFAGNRDPISEFFLTQADALSNSIHSAHFFAAAVIIASLANIKAMRCIYP